MPTPIPFVARRMQPLGHAPRSSFVPSQVSIAHSRLPMPMIRDQGHLFRSFIMSDGAAFDSLSTAVSFSERASVRVLFTYAAPKVLTEMAARRGSNPRPLVA